MNARALFFAIALSLAASLAAAQPTTVPADSLAWPEATQTSRPWTRWWWLGSAVDEANITRLLETYKAAGIGGVEITCIYGVKGAEDRVRPYLSDSWKAAVRHTLTEAKRLGMGVDLPTGSGWRTGGPSVTEEDGNRQLALSSEAVAGGDKLERDYSTSRPQAIVANGPDGKTIELTGQIGSDGRLAWQVPAGKWTIYTLSQQWSRDNVKRPAPGGEGRNINPYSRRSLDHFLDYFGTKLGDLPAAGIRAQFHDSFEYDGNWCDEFLTAFEKRRGYRLQEHLPALAANMGGRRGAGVSPASGRTGETPAPRVSDDEIARVKHDYRETLSDLVLDNLIKPWAEWSHAHGMLARNQSHGSPANWLDLYGAVDIPETESFGRLVGGDGHPLVFKFASSAAHVTGRPLVSSETATWLDEHFHETLGEIKEMTDRLFLSGINHILYHGTAYSPQDAAWPGWLFYASTELNPQNPIWHDLPALNAYVTRCQSMLQSTKPDNDILLYWPVHDLWQNASGLRMDLRVHNANEWLLNVPFGQVAAWLDKTGHVFDYISDEQLKTCQIVDGRIQTPGGRYATIIVPPTKSMPLATLEQLAELADAGATLAFCDGLPTGPPGVTAEREADAWKATAARFKLREIARDRVAGAAAAIPHLSYVNMPKPNDPHNFREEPGMRMNGKLNFTRRSWEHGHLYFVKNEDEKPFDGWVWPAVECSAAAIMDPLSGKTGMAETKPVEGSNAGRLIQLRLQLAPGQAAFVKTFREVPAAEFARWSYIGSELEGISIAGSWQVEFIAGGPELPPKAKLENLESWTKFAGAEGERFAGTARYTIEFDAPPNSDRCLLDLGKVADSARVELNGKPVATLIVAPFTVELSDLKPTGNRLAIEVTNVAANRIRDMDRRRVPWKIFNDINIVDINYRPLDASGWPVREAGLLGPVTIQPVKTQ